MTDDFIYRLIDSITVYYLLYMIIYYIYIYSYIILLNQSNTHLKFE